jgi:hypothetical protein
MSGYNLFYDAEEIEQEVSFMNGVTIGIVAGTAVYAFVKLIDFGIGFFL